MTSNARSSSRIMGSLRSEDGRKKLRTTWSGAEARAVLLQRTGRSTLPLCARLSTTHVERRASRSQNFKTAAKKRTRTARRDPSPQVLDGPARGTSLFLVSARRWM